MVAYIATPDPLTLAPPLLACLPTSFVSPQPPPALLPLLSPILRQRVQILTSVSASPTDSWLRLLCWDAGKAERVQTLVDGATFEPHPVSGEIELESDMPVRYRRVDEETLQALILLPDYSLKVVYLWCPTDQDGGGPGWRVAELLPAEGPADEVDEASWAMSIGEADARAREKIMDDALNAAEKSEQQEASRQEAEEEDEEDDDADYWARYDATPGRTPNVKTPAPNATSALQPPGPADDSYFSQYADVQPAMDNHDPSEDQPELGASSLNGDMLTSLLGRQVNGTDGAEPRRTNGFASTTTDPEKAMALNHPRPSSTPSSSSDAVARLEHEAESQSSCEIGVKHHISSNIKSLFRLAKCTGISRVEFQSLVQTELELLNLSDDD